MQNLSNNALGTEGARLVAKALLCNTSIVRVNLSGNLSVSLSVSFPVCHSLAVWPPSPPLSPPPPSLQYRNTLAYLLFPSLPFHFSSPCFFFFFLYIFFIFYFTFVSCLISKHSRLSADFFFSSHNAVEIIRGEKEQLDDNLSINSCQIKMYIMETRILF